MLSFKQLLKRAHLYERVKGSYLYDLFWRIADKRIIEDRNLEVEFYKKLLVGFRKGDLIFDVGANQGFKTGIFIKLGATVVAVDPDEANQGILRERFLTYRIKKKPVTVIANAISDKMGSATFWIDEAGSAKNTLDQKWVETLRLDTKRFGKALSFPRTVTVQTITLEDLIKMHGKPFFIKIDVEGHEASVLGGLKQAVPYLSFEVNLPEFREEGLKCVSLLDGLAASGRFNYIVGNRPELAGGWINAREFRSVLQQCGEESIEIFWKSSGSLS
jgi:FkbM family methyltransferase